MGEKCDFKGVIKEKFAVKKDDDSWKDLIRRRAFTVKNHGWKHFILG